MQQIVTILMHTTSSKNIIVDKLKKIRFFCRQGIKSVSN